MVGVSKINSVLVGLGSIVQVGNGVKVNVGEAVSVGADVGGKVLVAAGPTVLEGSPGAGVSVRRNGGMVIVGVEVISLAWSGVNCHVNTPKQ